MPSNKRAGVIVDAEAPAVVAGQRATHSAARIGQRGQNDVDEKTGVRRRVAHNAHAGFQHQVRTGGRHETERVGHRRTAQNQTVLAQLFRVHRHTGTYTNRINLRRCLTRARARSGMISPRVWKFAAETKTFPKRFLKPSERSFRRRF